MQLSTPTFLHPSSYYSPQKLKLVASGRNTFIPDILKSRLIFQNRSTKHGIIVDTISFESKIATINFLMLGVTFLCLGFKSLEDSLFLNY